MISFYNFIPFEMITYNLNQNFTNNYTKYKLTLNITFGIGQFAVDALKTFINAIHAFPRILFTLEQALLVT